MKHTITLLAAAAMLTLTGCATMHVQPHQVASRIDPISITSHTQFQEDVQTCTTLANDRTDNAFAKALLVGLAGAAAGAALGSTMGGVYNADVGQVAAAGAIAGATAGITTQAYKGMSKAQTIVYKCLIHRGYQLLY